MPKKEVNYKYIWIVYVVFTLTLLALTLVAIYITNQSPYQACERTIRPVIYTPQEVEKVEKVNKELKQTKTTKADNSYWVGKVSYYSHAGCMGCGESQTMANGEPFDENALTLAFNHLPLNTMVIVTNLDTGSASLAKVTDRGGFNAMGRKLANVPDNGLNRIADLSLGLCQAVGCKTDVSNIKIEKVQ